MGDFIKSAKFKILLAIFIVILFFLLRATWTGGLAPMTSQILGYMTTPVQRVSASISNTASEFFDTFFNARGISEENKELKSKVDELNAKLIEYDVYKRENQNLKEYLEIKEQNPEFDFETAAVISRDANDKFYSFTIDKGANSGISPRDAVITSSGLVGVVSEVGATYSKIVTILDTSLEISSINSSTREVGIASGRIDLVYDGLCQLNLVARDSTAKAGDLILTSGYGGLYPKGIIIGELIDVKTETHGISMYGIIKPMADVRFVSDVLVIKDFYYSSQQDIKIEEPSSEDTTDGSQTNIDETSASSEVVYSVNP